MRLDQMANLGSRSGFEKHRGPSETCRGVESGQRGLWDGSKKVDVCTVNKAVDRVTVVFVVPRTSPPSTLHASEWSCSSRDVPFRLRRFVLVPRLAAGGEAAHPHGQRVATALGIPYD